MILGFHMTGYRIRIIFIDAFLDKFFDFFSVVTDLNPMEVTLFLQVF